MLKLRKFINIQTVFINMSSVKIKRFFRKLLTEDLKTIVIFLLAILTIYNGYALILGWVSGNGAGFNTPSISPMYRAKYKDSDNDLLPDIIEKAPRGSKVYDPDTGTYIGRGTGTNPYAKDTDHDLFTDGTEDALGSNPNNWFDPGYVWIILLIAIAFYFINKMIEPNLLREYVEFDELQKSGGVAKGSSKFAYGSSTIFSKNLSKDEKKEIIKQDQRFKKLVGEENSEQEPEAIKKAKLKKKIEIIMQFIFVGLLVLVIFLQNVNL